MTDGVRAALAGLAFAAALAIAGLVLGAVESEFAEMLSSLALVVAVIAAVICLLRIGVDLGRSAR